MITYWKCIQFQPAAGNASVGKQLLVICTGYINGLLHGTMIAWTIVFTFPTTAQKNNKWLVCSLFVLDLIFYAGIKWCFVGRTSPCVNRMCRWWLCKVFCTDDRMNDCLYTPFTIIATWKSKETSTDQLAISSIGACYGQRDPYCF